jgi:hypothetical protein
MYRLSDRCLKLAYRYDRPGYPLRAQALDVLGGLFARLANIV